MPGGRIVGVPIWVGVNVCDGKKVGEAFGVGVGLLKIFDVLQPVFVRNTMMRRNVPVLLIR